MAWLSGVSYEIEIDTDYAVFDDVCYSCTCLNPALQILENFYSSSLMKEDIFYAYYNPVCRKAKQFSKAAFCHSNVLLMLRL